MFDLELKAAQRRAAAEREARRTQAAARLEAQRQANAAAALAAQTRDQQVGGFFFFFFFSSSSFSPTVSLAFCRIHCFVASRFRLQRRGGALPKRKKLSALLEKPSFCAQTESRSLRSWHRRLSTFPPVESGARLTRLFGQRRFETLCSTSEGTSWGSWHLSCPQRLCGGTQLR